MFNILVAEDDRDTRRLMQAVLEDANYSVETAENGLEALDIIVKRHIDLLLLDVMMPVMDGYQTAEKLRASGSELPIIMVTAKQEKTDKKHGFTVGIDDYMTKPVDEEELLLRIKALLRRSRIVSEQKLTVGSVVLDYGNLSVIRNGESLILPKKEFQILFKLLSYPERIFTRDELMEDIWGQTSDFDDHTLNVHMNRLRDRFSGCEDFDIVTVRGLGYKAVRKNARK